MITVGLPVFNQQKTLPVCLESINRQRNTGKFEVIVISETATAKDFKMLNHPDMVRFTIVLLDEWIPLPSKWARIGDLMHPDSVGMILQAADCYAHPLRICQSRAAMSSHDWYQERQGYFYDIGTRTMSIYSGYGKTHLNMCIAAKWVRALPECGLRKGIDRWMLSTIPNPRIFEVEGLHEGVDLHGDNNISRKRGRRIQQFRPPFHRTDKKIEDICELV